MTSFLYNDGINRNSWQLKLENYHYGKINETRLNMDFLLKIMIETMFILNKQFGTKFTQKKTFLRHITRKDEWKKNIILKSI